MYTLDQLKEKYKNIPKDLKQVNRWICYDIVKDEATGEEKKVPKCAFNGGWAKSNDSSTWTSFYVACLGCIKFNFYGLGFMLGNGFFGIDLDNHPDKVSGKVNMTEEQFFEFSKEFLDTLDTYAELSHSGTGIHIICKGTLPDGPRRRVGSSVEMYDKARFFTMTGNVIKSSSVSDCSESVLPLYNKYLKAPAISNHTEIDRTVIKDDGSIHFGEVDIATYTITSINNQMSDSELIQKISNSKNGREFVALYNGDMSSAKNDHSKADYDLCQILAFWTNNNFYQIDRIFRGSKLMREKWDSKRGDTTYGSQTINLAISRQVDTFKPKAKRIEIKNINEISNVIKQKPLAVAQEEEFKLDDNGDPIISEVKKSFKRYDLTDTGNAERFYDYFGKNFKFNKTNNYYMYWNNKKWVIDNKGFVKKYADKLIDILKQEGKELIREIDNDLRNGVDEKDEELVEKQTQAKMVWKNIDRVSNANGKAAMIEELKHLHTMPAINSEFDSDDYLLNTDSGVVDLDKNTLIVPTKNMMFSKSTNCEVSVEEPKLWLKFLHEIFERGNLAETEEIIHYVQKVLGYCLSGSTEQQIAVFNYGEGSNGKSVLMNVVLNVFGDYADTIDTDLLISNQNNSSQSTEFALANLVGLRLVVGSEIEEGKVIDEKVFKSITGGEKIKAQVKYGAQFTFKPKFKIIINTNFLPRIKGYSMWRRTALIPFLNTFEGPKKDIHLEAKLLKEKPQILNWIIDGYKMYIEEGIEKPKCLEEALASYKSDLDTLQRFINNECENIAGYETKARDLYNCYKDWAKLNNEFMLSESKFSYQLGKKGYVKKRTGNGYFYIGIKRNDDGTGHSFAHDDD